MPTVSVVIPAYNHEKYITDAIQSILDQTFQNFEVIITDDASTDNTVKKIKQFTDPRIQLFCLTQNQGISYSLDFSIAKAKGKYIALLGSDDIAIPERLEKQVAFLETHKEMGAVLSRAYIIDEESHPFTKTDHFYSSIFDKEHNRSRFEWLNYFFYHGNCLCAPSSLIRKSVYEKIGGHNSCYLQLQDFDFWIRLCFEFEFHILDDKLVKYRVRDNNMNISSDQLETRIRGEWEHRHILQQFFKIPSIEELLKIFPQLKHKYTDFIEVLIPFYIATLCLNTKIGLYAFPAIEALYNLLQTRPKLLAEKVNFSYPDFFKLVAASDIFQYATSSILQKEINSILNSKSWKLTKPLRWLARKMMPPKISQKTFDMPY